MKIHSNVTKFLIYRIVFTFFLASPVIVLFFQENGLNLTEIMVLQSFYSIAMVLFEVPTGAIADLVSRKLSLILGAIGATLAVLLYSLGHGFFDFLIAEVMFALGFALISGADTAFLYDTLIDEGKEKMYKKIYGNILSWSLITTAIAVILGGIIGQYNLRLTLTLEVPIFLVGIIIAMTFTEPKHKEKMAQKSYFLHIYDSLKFALIKNKEVRWLIVYSGVVSAAGVWALWFYQPYMKLTGLDIIYFGIAFALYNVVAAISSRFAHRVEEKIGKKISLISLAVFLVIGFVLMGSITWTFGFIFGFLFQFVRGFSTPVVEDYINKIVWSEKRATVMSIANLVGRLSFAVSAPFIGYFADVYSLQQALLLSGMVVLATGGVLLLLMKKDKVFET